MGEFALLEHTADVAISASGESLEEALAWLAAGMFSLIVDQETVVSSQCQRLSVTSQDREVAEQCPSGCCGARCIYKASREQGRYQAFAVCAAFGKEQEF